MKTAAVLHLILVIFLHPAGNTLVQAGLAPTSRERDYDDLGEGVSPRPTLPPAGSLHAVAPLERRQIGGSICGYESGVSAWSFECAEGRRCMTAKLGVGGGQLACCENSSKCKFFTSCRDLTAGCDSACMSNSRVAWCLSTDYPYCKTYTVSELRVSLMACRATPALRVAEMQLTYGTTPTTTPVTPPTPTPAKVPVGAIVGGVLGGLALIAGIILAVCVLFYLRRRGRRQDNNNNNHNAAHFQQQQQQPMSHVAHQPSPPQPQLQPTYFAPVPGAAAAPLMQPQQQQPAQQQTVEGKFGGAAYNYADAAGGAAGGPGKHASAAGLPPYQQGGYEMHPQHSGIGGGGAAVGQPQATSSTPVSPEASSSPVGPAHPPWPVYEVPNQPHSK